jgi:hypothetical protein
VSKATGTARDRRSAQLTLRAFLLSLLCVVFQQAFVTPTSVSAEAEAGSDELRGRVEQLERENARLRLRATRDAWKRPAAWQRLERGMTRYEVMMTLGEPGKIAHYEGFERWEYPDFRGGRVNFNGRGRLGGWSPPRRRYSNP